MEVINHFSHEEHPLILKELQEDDQGGLEKVDCYGCKQPISTKSKTYYYCCSECNVFLHKSCAELQREITHPVHPEHPFQLLAKPSYWSGTCECNICDNSWDAFTYQCSTCEFDVDVLCFQSLIGALKHPGHHHPLKHQPRKALFKCYACGVKDEDESYYCTECSFWIHKTCGSMTSITSVKFHPEISDYSLCSKCDWYTNGFMYECKECDFVADVKCALLPATLKHEAHKHLLVQGEFSKELFCDGCSNKHDDIFFNCKTCPYKLALDCARLPTKVRHRWDRHPLILSFPPYYYHPDEFICDICGEECHPKYWLYHCRECNNSFHPCCIPRFDQWPNVSFGSKLRIDYHSHPLTFTRTVHYDKFSCDKCGQNLKGEIAFQCEPCYFNMCHPCVDEIVLSRRGQSTPEVE